MLEWHEVVFAILDGGSLVPKLTKACRRDGALETRAWSWLFLDSHGSTNWESSTTGWFSHSAAS